MMDALTWTHALEHANRSLVFARSHLRFDTPPEDVPLPSHQRVEDRVRAQIARLERLVREVDASRDAAATVEAAASDLDREVAALDDDVVGG